MVRRRTAVPTAALALLLASPALTACGSGPNRTGAAAVVGDQRIAVSTVQSQVADLRTAVARNPQAAQALSGTSDLSTHVLNLLVQDKVVDKALADAHLTVTAGEVQREYNGALQQLGGGNVRQLQSAMLAQYGTMPGQINDFLRQQVAFAKIISALGYQAGSDGGNTALTRQMVKTAKSLHVHINPRYGAWDAKNASIRTVKDPWVVDKTPVASSDGAAAPADIA